MVGLRGREGDWFWRKSWIGGLTSTGGGEWLQLTDISVFIWGMHDITENNSLNWLFGVS